MRLLIFCFCSLFLILGCKNSDDTSKAAVQAEEVINPNVIENMNWTFLTNGVFHYKNKVVVGEKLTSNPVDGQWLDFKDNGSFDQGTWDKLDYSGSWTYSDETQLLEFLPNSDKGEASEWRVLNNENNLVLVGTAKYMNNNVQMRLVRNMEKPVKSE
jgi:hypothetical protein